MRGAAGRAARFGRRSCVSRPGATRGVVRARRLRSSATSTGAWRFLATGLGAAVYAEGAAAAGDLRVRRDEQDETGASIRVRSAELTGAGESVQVRREGKANHYFHREPCGRTREGAVEASVAARVAGMIEHRKRYDPERRGFLIDRRQHLQSRHGEGLPGSALSEESRDARTPLYRDSGGLQFASAVVPGPRKKGDNPNR